ncbi:hypothetical protein A1QO_03970 [Vibrio genomosp. F10 str. ZF-129]|uniref:Uncharacterized protein n=1 Tax=Vibrio genomosp. F10 str. ZF-129 TaxID=1187848 RepID=A0A1E5BIM4_9VIBR|nr:hypothetical protein [Vibrio genomosp. F10]OEE37268.1 hypothetical protein A1QO_03970 [Vibrio genomosp. F10 str. ZF-129]
MKVIMLNGAMANTAVDSVKIIATTSQNPFMLFKELKKHIPDLEETFGKAEVDLALAALHEQYASCNSQLLLKLLESSIERLSLDRSQIQALINELDEKSVVIRKCGNFLHVVEPSNDSDKIQYPFKQTVQTLDYKVLFTTTYKKAKEALESLARPSFLKVN